MIVVLMLTQSLSQFVVINTEKIKLIVCSQSSTSVELFLFQVRLILNELECVANSLY
jgi:hypothetical protein